MTAPLAATRQSLALAAAWLDLRDARRDPSRPAGTDQLTDADARDGR
jgi:hypothetical protein